jgi:hypothetical protein
MVAMGLRAARKAYRNEVASDKYSVGCADVHGLFNDLLTFVQG